MTGIVEEHMGDMKNAMGRRFFRNTFPLTFFMSIDVYFKFYSQERIGFQIYGNNSFQKQFHVP